MSEPCRGELLTEIVAVKNIALIPSQGCVKIANVFSSFSQPAAFIGRKEGVVQVGCRVFL